MNDPSPGHLAPGSVLADRYEIVRRLGTGGMGTVYLARHRLMERLCAIKLLHPALARDAEALQRFTGEARNASRIHHPNVCTVYDFGATAEDQVYLAMEYIEGRSLGTILAEQGALPLHRAAGLVEAIAAGLDAAHTLGIVHRDLKPDNVMVVATATRETVKLVDFGIAKALEREVARDLTAPGTVVGTPDYMSPEQFAGDPADRRSDVYALGLMVYRMVTGALPFRADTARETLTRRLTEAPEPLAAAAPGVAFPAGLQAVMDRALARRPEDRYPGALELATAMRESLVDLPANAADTFPTVRLDAVTRRLEARATTPARRPILWLAPVGLLGLAVTMAVVIAVRRPAPAGSATEDGGPGADPVTVLQDTGGAGATDTNAAGSTRSPEPDTQPMSRAVAPPPSPQPPPALPGRETAPAEPPPIPALPTADEVMNAATREAARLRAESIYRRQDADAATRAIAAYTVSSAYLQDGALRLAEVWADRALTENRNSPPGAERDERSARYARFLTMVRTLKDSTPP